MKMIRNHVVTAAFFCLTDGPTCFQPRVAMTNLSINSLIRFSRWCMKVKVWGLNVSEVIQHTSWLKWWINVGFSPLSVSPQAVGMFLGELSCLVVFYILLCHDRQSPEPKMNPGQSFNPLLFFPPAMCDMTATSIMYVGKCIVNGCGHSHV